MSETRRRFQAREGGDVKGTRGPFVMVVKRDGVTQPFSRDTMIESMRNAGATAEEANLVTNRVSQRLLDRDTIPSTEISTMVARSLSHVNSDASRNYVANRDLKLAYTQQMNMLSAEIGAISQQVGYVTTNLDGFDNQIANLQTRIAKVRQGNYLVLTNLEKDQSSLATDWMELSPQLRRTASLQGENIRTRVQSIQQTLNSRLVNTDYDPSTLQSVQSGIQELQQNLSQMEGVATAAMSPLEKRFESIDKDLRKAENTLAITSQASFQWEQDESPIIATKVKDLNNDVEGFLTLTNHRFILETNKEIALKKVLFIVTEKKNVRETVVQKPVGMVSQLIHGKVGFFKGSGVFVQFASESGIPEMKFDTSGQEADWMVESYNFIISGQADKELATLTQSTTVDQEKMQLAVCPVCGAPYREKIYRGQTSVNCKYCGAVITISQRG